MYAHTTERPSRMAAAALLAVSAGACVGVALSYSPAASSLYAATAVRPAVTSQVAVGVPRTQMQAYTQYDAEPVQMAYVQPSAQATPTVSTWTVLSGGFLAATAAMAALFFKSSSVQSSEQLAMLAASGKKGAKAAPKAKSAEARPLWYPTAEAPEWLDGSLPGDRGFDPLGLSKPTEYLQFDLDALDQNAPKNRAGNVIGRVQAKPDQVSGEALAPYSEVFGLQRFRECELIHGRWAMLAVLGAIVGESVTGVAWQDAGLVEVTNGYSYWGNSLPFTGTQLAWIEVIAMGAVEAFRNTELDTEKRCYPGGAFDPLGLASGDAATTFRLREAELKHGRLAMIAFLGFAVQALKTGLGATQGFGDWAITTFN